MRRADVGARLDRALGQVRFTPEMERAVRRRMEGPPRRSGFKRAIVAVAVCAALLTAALAAGPAIWEAIQAHLGARASYATRPQAAVTDQGFELGVAAALADRNVIRVYLTLRDLEGDRLRQGAELDLWPLTRDEAGGLIPDPTAPASGRPMETVRYDGETGTLTFCQTYYRQSPREDLDLSVSEIIPGFQDFYLDLNGEKLARAVPAETLESAVGEDGKRYLLPEQNPMEMDWEKCPLPEGEEPGIRVSSFGYAEDGRLHVRFETAEDIVLTGVDLPYFGGWDMELMAELPDGLDYAFPPDCPSRDMLADSVVFFFTGDYSTQGGPVEGDWSLNVPLEPVESLTLDWTGGPVRDPAGRRGPAQVEGMWLSPLGLSMRFSAADTPTHLYPKTAALTMADGSRVETQENTLAVGLEQEGQVLMDLVWELEEPVDLEQVVSVTVYDQTVAVRGDPEVAPFGE